MTNKPANCARCGRPIRTAYCIAGLPEVNYCSRTCVDAAFETFIQGRRKKTANNIELAEDPIPEPDHDLDSEESSIMESLVLNEFGDATIVRHICDRKGCGKPITLIWKGRDGEYCSFECKEKTERVTKEMPETNVDTMADDSPVTAGKSTADKKKKKKVEAPKAKAKAKTAAPPEAKKSKANGKANGSGRDTAIGAQVIHLTKKEGELKGKRGQIYKLIKNGMTVSQLQDAAARKLGDDSFKSRALAVLRTCVENDLCTVK
jgi:hypothetical protein